MIGNRVRLIFRPYVGDPSLQQSAVSGVLHKLDAAGATIWRENSLPEGQGTVFIPMQRIHEIVDLGRAP